MVVVLATLFSRYKVVPLALKLYQLSLSMPMEKIVAALPEAIWTTSTVDRAPVMSHAATDT